MKTMTKTPVQRVSERRPDPGTLLSVRDLTIEAGSKELSVRLADRFSLDMAPGDRVALVGESGSGKSVTARAIMRLDYGVDTGIKLSGLQALSDLVYRETGLPNPALKPVTGGYAYLKSTSADVLSSLRDGVRTFPPISGYLHADAVGADIRWVWDRLSTRAMVRQLATNLGLELDLVEVEAVCKALNDAIDGIPEYPRWLTPEQASALCQETVDFSRQVSQR